MVGCGRGKRNQKNALLTQTAWHKINAKIKKNQHYGRGNRNQKNALLTQTTWQKIIAKIKKINIVGGGTEKCPFNTDNMAEKNAKKKKSTIFRPMEDVWTFGLLIFLPHK
jgi:uridylate kinase